MGRPKGDPLNVSSKCFYCRLTERNHKLIYYAAERYNMNISEIMNKLIKDNIRLRPKK